MFSEYTLAQQATLSGTVKSKQEIAIDGVSVEYKKIGTISDSDGKYLIMLPANIELSIVFSHLAYKNQVHKMTLYEGENRNLDLLFDEDVKQISEVDLVDDALRFQNVTTIDKKNLNVITGPTGGVEALISTLAGVSSKNEMSSQYSVREVITMRT